ncbi:MAG: hypothetical protein OJI67_10155, partial [Prosthecobacter sp.]|nr:hypothetical protein [Prosthecobacter sp.]
MKPAALAHLLKTFCHGELPSIPSEVVQHLRGWALFPQHYSRQQFYSFSFQILKGLPSAKTVPLTFPSASSPSPSSSSEIPSTAVLTGLTAFREAFLRLHPDNRLFIETSTDGTYIRSTFILGPAVRLSAKHSTGQYDVDGTYFRRLKEKKRTRQLLLPGFIKGVVYSDANNSYYPIAIQHDTVEETEDGYRHLLANLWDQFPHTSTPATAYGADRDTGLLAFLRRRQEAGNSTPHFVFCVVHIKRNILARYSGKQNKILKMAAKSIFEKIAFCKRSDQTKVRLQKLIPPSDSDLDLTDDQKMKKDIYDYLCGIGPELYCDALMTAARPEKLTSNSVESF